MTGKTKDAMPAKAKRLFQCDTFRCNNGATVVIKAPFLLTPRLACVKCAETFAAKGDKYRIEPLT